MSNKFEYRGEGFTVIMDFDKIPLIKIKMLIKFLGKIYYHILLNPDEKLGDFYLLIDKQIKLNRW